MEAEASHSGGMGWLSGWVRLVYPPVCRLCEGMAADWNGYLCAECSAELWRPGERYGACDVIPFVSWMGWLGPYDGATRAAVHAMKFGRQRELARHLGWMLARRMPVHVPRPDLVVPVPCSEPARRARGFDQAEELALGMGEELGGEVACRLLTRRGGGRPQRSLPLERRAANVRGVFGLRSCGAVRSRRVALVDDVATTGATLAAAARLLRGCGALEVSAFVVARTGSWRASRRGG